MYTMYCCSKCGTTNEPGMLFCQHCGARLKPPSQQDQQPPAVAAAVPAKGPQLSFFGKK
jgi:uncharacterized membrane protein YvbJ